jgi:hypothetical protein
MLTLTSSTVVGVFLPSTATYNQRFMATGNTGFGGGINWPGMGIFHNMDSLQCPQALGTLPEQAMLRGL